LQIAKRHHQGSFKLSFNRVCSFKADQVEYAKNRGQVSGHHPTDAAMSCALIHVASVSRNRYSHLFSRCNFISIAFAAKLLCVRKQMMTWLVVSEKSSCFPVTQCHAFDSGCRIRLPMSAFPHQQFLLQHSVRVHGRARRCGDRVAFTYIRKASYDQRRHGRFSSF